MHLGNCEPREQSRGCRARVEGRKVLSVRDETLKDPPSEVVGVVDPGSIYFLDREFQRLKDAGRRSRRNLIQDVPADGEYGPVVDLEDF